MENWKMSESKWTREQLEAITESGCNLLVAAAAGAGKTAVLVERIIRKITDEKKPVDIDKLLIVTFTNAAATEMRERIGDAVIKELDRHPDSRALQRQLTLLHRANITTIHSFCLDVIKSNFHLIDMDPGFRIADATESLLLKTEILEELFEDMYQGEGLSQEFIQLVECYGGRTDDSPLQEMVLNLYDFVQSHPWPDMWLKKNTEAFNLPEGLDFGTTQWAKVLFKSIGIELLGLLSMLKKAVNIILESEGLDNYLPVFQEDVANLENLLSAISVESTWDELHEAFSRLEFARLPRCGKDPDTVRQEQVKAIRNYVKDRLKIIKDDIFTSDSAAIIRDLRNLHPLIGCLSHLAEEFGRRYAAKKAEKALMDFNDLEHFCLNILAETDEEGNVVPSRIAMDFRERFEEILVDEYQDSNLVQEVILGTISRKDSDSPNMFMVGDVKQSIYRFRQAKPELFLEKYNTYASLSGHKERKILLYKNFRSREEIINGVNYIFKQMMSENIGELIYDDNEELNYGSNYEPMEESGSVVGGCVELNIIDMNAVDNRDGHSSENIPAESAEDETANSDDEEEMPDSIQSEARLAAKRIKELVGALEDGRVFKVYDKKINGYRRLEYRDIVILLRTTKNWADIFVEELEAQAIPVYADTGAGYFNTVEVKTMMSLLQIIDNPMQDIPLLSVLRSPIAFFTPDELIDIRLSDRDASFYEALKKTAAAEGNGISEKAAKFLGKLEIWRDKALYMPTDELIWNLYNDTGYYSYAGAMPGGIQRQANLRILMERARQYEETSYKGLFNFINFINRLKSGGGDMGSAKILGENADVVRIMSIHKSKGLEFPVVIAAGCGKQFNLQDMNRSILLHQDLGFGPDYVDYRRRISYPALLKQSLKHKIKLETLSEEMRILYVAFTRAREKLIVIGNVKSIKNAAVQWSDSLTDNSARLPEYVILKGRSYLDWLGPALLRHKDCSALRHTAGINTEDTVVLHEDRSRWGIKIWCRSEILSDSSKGGREEKEFSDLLAQLSGGEQDSGIYDEIKRRLNWEYPYKASAKLPSKVSVTELKKRFAVELAEDYLSEAVYTQPLVKRPAFMEEFGVLSAAEKGTALHFVMQHLNLKHVECLEDIKCQVDEMVSNELLSEQQAGSVDIHSILSFFRSSVGKRLLKAERVSREVSFNIEIESERMNSGAANAYNDTILLQGVIDCFFEEQGDIVLVDYKTDYVDAGNTDIIKERYRAQIDYYTLALERLTGKRVKEKYLYLFWNGSTISY